MKATWHKDENLPEDAIFPYFIRLHDGSGGYAPICVCESPDEARLISHLINSAIINQHADQTDALEAYLATGVDITGYVHEAVIGD